MATKRSTLPSPTSEDLKTQPDRIRRTPNGGLAWNCHYCGEYASSETQQGRYVCRRHGGTTPKQRSGTATPPGRPMTTGEHTRGERLSITELVEHYEATLHDVTATDEHMTYLRAHLDLSSSTRETEDEIEQALFHLCHEIDKLTTFITGEARGMDHNSATDAVFRLSLYARIITPTREQYDAFLRQTKAVEHSHARLINATKTRINTSHKHAKLHQLREFTQIIPRILTLLEPRLDRDTVSKLQARLRSEFATIPSRALQPNTINVPEYTHAPQNFAERGTLIDKLAARFASFGVDPDMPHRDLLHLKAHLQALTSLHDTVTTTADRLEHCRHVLNTYFCEIGISKNGEPRSVKEILCEYRLGRILDRIERDNDALAKNLRALAEQLAERHHRIIELASVLRDIELLQHTVEDVNLQRHLIKKLHAVLLDMIPAPEIEYLRPYLPLNYELPPVFDGRDMPPLPNRDHPSHLATPSEEHT